MRKGHNYKSFRRANNYLQALSFISTSLLIGTLIAISIFLDGELRNFKDIMGFGLGIIIMSLLSTPLGLIVCLLVGIYSGGYDSEKLYNTVYWDGYTAAKKEAKDSQALQAKEGHWEPQAWSENSDDRFNGWTTMAFLVIWILTAIATFFKWWNL